MKSSLPKVLHAVAGRPMLGHVLSAASVGGGQTIVVIGPNMQNVADNAAAVSANISLAIQHEQRGTGDAVKSALPHITSKSGVALVIFGDTPLVRPQTLNEMIAACTLDTPVVVLGFEAVDPAAYGRLVKDKQGNLSRIVELKDANDEERAITLCNGGAMAISLEHLGSLISKLAATNKAGEFYLTDIVEHARLNGSSCTIVTAPETDIQGVNSRSDLAKVEQEMQRRLRAQAMSNGVTLADPNTVYLSADTIIGQDVTIGQNVVIGPGVEIASGVTIKPFSHLEGGKIEQGAQIGPFARIRPGSEIGRDVHIGNFVETKKAVVGEGSKINHLSYVGDASLGRNVNVGAGTITCNYDGVNKFKTEIGDGVFVGSNTSLVAPVTVAAEATIGAGSTITRNVAESELAVARGKQRNINGWKRPEKK